MLLLALFAFAAFAVFALSTFALSARRIVTALRFWILGCGIVCARPLFTNVAAFVGRPQSHGFIGGAQYMYFPSSPRGTSMGTNGVMLLVDDAAAEPEPPAKDLRGSVISASKIC